jgi:light-independent protochlorophyllide reductase subunit B
MQLTLWTYEGPPHVGAMRVATAMTGLHYVLHAPQGDTYADLLFTMIERRQQRPPVTYTTFQARDLGGDTAQLFKDAALQAFERFSPQAMIVGSSCTAELIQDDPGGLAKALNLPVPVIALELPSYQRKENWGAAETFYQLVRVLVGPTRKPLVSDEQKANRRPRCNLLGATALGFRHRDDLREVRELLQLLGVDVHLTAPWQASPADLARLTDADFNIVMYPEVAGVAAGWLERTHGMPRVTTVPIGTGATLDFINDVARVAGVDAAPALAAIELRARWYARSVDSTYLTGKRVFIFGDATHAIAAARVASREMGFRVVGLGSYSREFGRELREAAKLYGLDALITDDYLEVEERINELQPDLVLGTQMERHIAKRLGLPCAVISAPVHVQDFPARHAPQMGVEGANVMFDTWVHPLMMGLEEHLLAMFKEDFEFHGDAAASHLGSTSTPRAQALAAEADPAAAEAAAEVAALATAAPAVAAPGAPFAAATTEPTAASAGVSAAPAPAPVDFGWAPEAEKELHKIPFFVRGRARRNTERFARDRGLTSITIETLYDAKAHYSA